VSRKAQPVCPKHGEKQRLFNGKLICYGCKREYHRRWYEKHRMATGVALSPGDKREIDLRERRRQAQIKARRESLDARFERIWKEKYAAQEAEYYQRDYYWRR
jgi:hypothetical protein